MFLRLNRLSLDHVLFSAKHFINASRSLQRESMVKRAMITFGNIYRGLMESKLIK